MIQALRKSGFALGIGFALISAVIYGVVPNFARLAFLNGVPALETVLYRTSAVGVMLAIIAVLRNESFVVKPAARGAFVFQCLATLLVSSCYLASVQFLPVTLSVILFYTFPILVLLTAPLIERRRPGLMRLAVCALGFLGLWVAVGPALEKFNILGIILAFLGAVGCAMQFFSGRMIGRHMTPAAFGSLVHIAIWPVMVLLTLYFGGGHLALVDGSGLGPWALSSVGLVCLAYLGGYSFHMMSVRAAPSSVVAPYFNLEPIMSTAVAVFVLGEAMTTNQWMGGAMVFAALVLSGFIGEKGVS